MAIVVIDPGHGGQGKLGGSSANNATSPSGLLEKDLALTVAKHAEANLGARGHNVRLTRTGDVNLSLMDRAAVARSARADAFVSIHFNGFGDATVQGTETWVHQNGSALSVDLASCVQRAVLKATRHKDRGVRRKVLGVVDPANHAASTAACLAELSFITTSAEDERLQDPDYVRALGEAVADGVQEFVGQQGVQSDVITEAAVAGPVIVTAGRPASFRTPVAFSASATLSPTAAAITTLRPPVVDVRAAIDALPKKGRKTKFAGPVVSGGETGHSHIQGLAGYRDVFLVTHSDTDHESGRILVLDRVKGHKVVKEFRLPTFSASGPSFFHAGGCQVIGDVLAVPSESGKNASVIAFFDVSDPMQIKELNGALRIVRDTRDAAAVGITTVTRGGEAVWLLAVYDSGTVDFYESPDLPGGALFAPRFTCKVDEKDHQHLLLFTDQANQVFAVGLNRGNLFFFDKLVLYAVDLAAGTMTPDPDRDISTGGGTRLRWGATLEAAGDRLELHCTERDYGASCTINTFRQATPPAGSAVRAAGRRSRAKGPTRRAVAKKARRPRKPARAGK